MALNKSMVFDMSENEKNLANVDYILTNIIAIMNYMKTDEIKKLRENNVDEYKEHMEEKFQYFSDPYYSIFQKIIRGDDITPIIPMLSMITKIEKNECTLEQAEELVGTELSKRFIKNK